MMNSNASKATLWKYFFRNHHERGPCRHFGWGSELGCYDTVHTYLKLFGVQLHT